MVERVRRISIFGRKASGQSSEGLQKPSEGTTLEQPRQRSRKGLRSEIFHSNDSLNDGRSTPDQLIDEEHGKKANSCIVKALTLSEVPELWVRGRKGQLHSSLLPV